MTVNVVGRTRFTKNHQILRKSKRARFDDEDEDEELTGDIEDPTAENSMQEVKLITFFFNFTIF